MPALTFALCCCAQPSLRRLQLVMMVYGKKKLDENLEIFINRCVDGSGGDLARAGALYEHPSPPCGLVSSGGRGGAVVLLVL